MRELGAMWRNTRMVVLCAISAALYAAVLVPFKVVPLIPGVTELRPVALKQQRMIEDFAGMQRGEAAPQNFLVGCEPLVAEFLQNRNQFGTHGAF